MLQFLINVLVGSWDWWVMMAQMYSMWFSRGEFEYLHVYKLAARYNNKHRNTTLWCAKLIEITISLPAFLNRLTRFIWQSFILITQFDNSLIQICSPCVISSNVKESDCCCLCNDELMTFIRQHGRFNVNITFKVFLPHIWFRNRMTSVTALWQFKQCLQAQTEICASLMLLWWW